MSADQVLWMCIPPVIIVIGTIGNTLTIVLLTKFVSWSQCYIYITLAVADLAVISINFTQRWLENAFHINIVTHNVACRLYMLFYEVAFELSAWLVVLITIERMVAVCFPILFRRFGKRLTNVGIIVCAVFVLLVNIRLLWLSDVMHYDNGKIHCSAVVHHHKVSNVIKLLMYSLLPCCLIFGMNSITVMKLYLSAQRTRTNKRISNRSRATRRQTILMFVVSTAFIVTTLPYAVYVNINETLYTTSLTHTILRLLAYTNHCINFFLYIVAHNTFRSKLILLFRKVCTGADSNAHFSKISRKCENITIDRQCSNQSTTQV